MISGFQKRPFSSILQNSYFENVIETFFKVQTFNKSLKKVMESFFNIKNLRTRKKVMEPFFNIKSFKSRKESDGVFLSITNFKSRKKVTESFLRIPSTSSFGVGICQVLEVLG